MRQNEPGNDLKQVNGRPLVSVIVPTYNQERLIRHSLRSIAEQDYRPIEIMVCDDESTDGTEMAVREFRNEEIVRYIKVKHTGNPAATMNAGLKEARGEIIMFLDGDDQWLPEKVKKQVEYLLAHPQCDLVFGDGYSVFTDSEDYIVPDPGRDQTQCKYFQQRGRISIAHILSRNPIFGAGLAFPRRVLEKSGMLNEACRAWDVEFLFRLFAGGGAVDFLNEPFYVYRKGRRNITNRKDWLYLTLPERMAFIEMVKHLLPRGEVRHQLQRLKYEYMKEAVKFGKLPEYSALAASPFYPDAFSYRLKLTFYYALIRFGLKEADTVDNPS